MHADDDPLAALDGGLEAVGRVGDLRLRVALLDGGDHAAAAIDLVEIRLGLRLDPVGQLLDEVRAAERVGDARRAGLVREHLLRAQRDRRRLERRDRVRLVVAVRVQRLRAAEHARERLDRRAGDVDERLLRRQRDAGGLAVGAQLPRARVARADAVAHQPRPHPPRRAQLRDLLEEVDVAVEEEREARQEAVGVDAARDELLGVGERRPRS